MDLSKESFRNYGYPYHQGFNITFLSARCSIILICWFLIFLSIVSETEDCASSHCVDNTGQETSDPNFGFMH